MKNFKTQFNCTRLCVSAILHALLALSSTLAYTNENPSIGSQWTLLRKSPLFESAAYTLAGVWGPSIPTNNQFLMEKSYGRWIYGTPIPMANMKKKDFAPKGWVYNRNLLHPNDTSTISEALLSELFLSEYYFEKATDKYPLTKSKALYLSFLSNLVLSESTLQKFSELDESETARAFFNMISIASILEIPSANAKEKKMLDLGFAGANLNFLQFESNTLKKKRQLEEKRRQAKILKAPIIPPISNYAKTFILGRYIADKNIELPKLSNEEVDTYLYLRALTTRVLRNCPNPIIDFWKNKPWLVYRMNTITNRPSDENLWIQIALPGNQFFHSNQVLRLAKNEAELAFILIWPMVLATRYEPKEWELGVNWEDSISSTANNDSTFTSIQQQQSFKQSKTMDVADAIATDKITSECIAKAGYYAEAGLEYVLRLRSNKRSAWASWFIDHSIGLDYRLEQFRENLTQGMAAADIPNGKIQNKKRFFAAQKLWNL